MPRRPTAQLQRDRAALLAVLEAADGPVTTAAVLVELTDGSPQTRNETMQHLVPDLEALARKGAVRKLSQSWDPLWHRWALAGTAAADELEDLMDVKRQLSSWSPAPEVT